MTLKVLDLFSGIGGFSLGLERAGMKTIAFCEIEKYPRQILKKHWPEVPIFEDVRKLKGEDVGAVDVICGGFPCQPFSVAGQQRGKDDDRHLWPEMLRLLQETRPRWLIGENVAGFISMALDDVLSDLEGEGYTCQSFVIPACAVGGIHRRDRVWIVAHSTSQGLQDGRQTGQQKSGKENQSRAQFRSERYGELGITANPQHDAALAASEPEGEGQAVCTATDVADTNNSAAARFRGNCFKVLREQKADGHNEAPIRESHTEFRPIGIPTQPPVRSRDDGLPNNVARLKALGNAVVPQIPEIIGRAIMSAEGF